jgi:RNA polymerase sigma-70 factor (ECF subfamily)
MVDDDLSALIARAKQGDEEANRVLLELEHDIRMMVRVRLPKKLRSQFDSMDFVQDVWESFLSDVDRGPGRFTSHEQIRNYLAGIARNKVLEEHRKRTKVRKYDIEREEPLYIRKGDQDLPREVLAHDPSPSQDAQARERLDQLLAGRSPRDAAIIRLRSTGLSLDEIAARTGVNERTVRRVIDETRRRMEERQWQ